MMISSSTCSNVNTSTSITASLSTTFITNTICDISSIEKSHTNGHATINASRLKHLLNLEKNYIQIIAEGVQQKISAEKTNETVLRGP
jgi:hypothetical protein